ncbi:gpi transamidase component pig-u [Anaeramoeba ignava]|uniref:Gpi transamidase component pig-u n=1 Tax=Anaeramoeba ignava TaxID=1746090 RepID=A0A9Q0REY2_ANAIG|nr:gpi transamidase component pig-u [Anaeramoeba ignava]
MNFKRIFGFILTSFLGIFIRTILFHFHFDEKFIKRIEFSTPFTNIRRLKEGIFLSQNGLSPYEGNTFHQMPILFYFFSLLNSLKSQKFIENLIFATTDFLCLILIFLISENHLQKKEFETKNKNFFFANFSIFLSLFCLSKTTAIFPQFFLLLTLFTAQKGWIFLSTFFLSCSVYLDIYYILLIIPVILLLRQKKKISIFMIIFLELIWVLSLLSLSITFLMKDQEITSSSLIEFTRKLLQNKKGFIHNSLLFSITAKDRTPNVGLFWYLMIEIFSNFKNLFLFIFQFQVVPLIIPLTLQFSKNPEFLFSIIALIISTFHPYAELGRMALSVALLLTNITLLKHMRNLFLVSSIFLFSISLLPLFWFSWINQGTGNSNFFYGATLALGLANIWLIGDSVHSALKFQFEIKNNKKNNNNNN